MKIFKKAQVLCPYCHTWLPQQRLVTVPKKLLTQLEEFSDGEPADKFSRAWSCPRCQCIIVRSPKEARP
jgi:hypothetical protein